MDDVARALGAGGDEVTIAGKKAQIRPLSVRELTEIERECVRNYRREYLKRLKDTVEFIGEDAFQKAVYDSATWDVHNLPRKTVYDPRLDQLTPGVIQWLVDHADSTREGIESNPVKALRALATVLDNEALSADEFARLAGSPCRKISTGYANWWVTGSFDGMVELAFYALRDSGITREDLLEEFSKRQDQLWQVAREAEHLSTPAMGNGQDPSK